MKHLKLAGFLFIFCAAVMRAETQEAVEEMVDAAKELLSGFSPELREKAMFEFKSVDRFDWHFVPKDRKGVSLKELEKKQQNLVYALLDSALGRNGFIKASSILTMEQVLFEKENKSPMRDPGNYFVTFYGEPAAAGTWGWRFEGHHLSINLTIVDGKLIAATPMFIGSNPAEVMEGPHKGLRPLATEEDLGRHLVNLLDEEQRRSAIFSEKAPRDIITGAQRKVTPLTPDGLSFREMNREQCELLLKLTKEYIYRVRAEIADSDWKKIRTAGFENIYFAWAGGIKKGEGYYYRVQGPTFLLECDNTQNNANHIHTVWRDFENDFGEDLLKKHHERHPHPPVK